MKLPSSYDVIGSREKAVAVVELTDEFKGKEKEVAEAIVKRHKNVVSVLKKSSERKGVYRKRRYRLLGGDKNTEVIHKESGCRFKLDPRTVYFSPRESTERQRVAKQVDLMETVMVMFAGVGPYPIVIAKKQPLSKIVAIEINPDAVDYMEENVKLNKITNQIIAVLGDVSGKCKMWYGECDRVVMPLPHNAIQFLDQAVECLKPEGGVIHLYLIERKNKIKETVKNIVQNLGNKWSVGINIKQVLEYAPRTYKYCVDITLTK